MTPTNLTNLANIGQRPKINQFWVTLKISTVFEMRQTVQRFHDLKMRIFKHRDSDHRLNIIKRIKRYQVMRELHP